MWVHWWYYMGPHYLPSPNSFYIIFFFSSQSRWALKTVFVMHELFKGKHPRQPDASHGVLSSSGFIIIAAVGTVTADDSQSKLYIKSPFRSEFTWSNSLDSIKFQNKKRPERFHQVLRGTLEDFKDPKFIQKKTESVSQIIKRCSLQSQT